MIESAIIDGIDVLTMQHGKANALDIEFCEALAARFTAARLTDTKAIVLTGTGRIFSAGVNLKRVSAGGAAYVREFLPYLHRLYEAMFFHPKPVVASINGYAVAGGCVLAACAVTRSATVSAPAIRWPARTASIACSAATIQIVYATMR